MQVSFNPIMTHAVVLLSNNISFIALLLLPSIQKNIARTVQVSAQCFMICRTAACVLTADFVFIARVLNLAPSEGDDAEECGETLQDHCGTAFARKIAPLMPLSLQRPRIP